MCINVSVTWACGHHYRTTLQCGDKDKPRQPGAPCTGGPPYGDRWGYQDVAADVVQYIKRNPHLRLTWCCSSQCCYHDIQRLAKDATRAKGLVDFALPESNLQAYLRNEFDKASRRYEQAFYDHINESCFPQFMQGLYKCPMMFDDMGQSCAADIVPDVNPSAAPNGIANLNDTPYRELLRQGIARGRPFFDQTHLGRLPFPHYLAIVENNMRSSSRQ